MKIIEVEKILRFSDNTLTETCLIKFTFDITILPATLKSGYESAKVRPKTLCSHFFGDGQNYSLSARLQWERKKSKNRICLLVWVSYFLMNYVGIHYTLEDLHHIWLPIKNNFTNKFLFTKIFLQDLENSEDKAIIIKETHSRAHRGLE